MFCITYFIVIEFTKKTTINTTKHVAKLLFNISFKKKSLHQKLIITQYLTHQNLS